MRKFSYLALIVSVVAFAACKGKDTAFIKGDKGIEYKIIKDGSGKTIGYGNFIQIHLLMQYKDDRKDTIISDSREYASSIQPLDSITTPLEYFKILIQLRKGDSLVMRRLVDSVFAKSPESMPPYMNKKGYLYTTVKLLDIFETKDQADAAQKAEMKQAKPRIFKKQMETIGKEMDKFKAQRDADDKLISDYLAKNNIKAIKSPMGVYVAFENEGTGEKINGNSVVTLNYTGKTFDSSKVFDSNVDPAFGHVQPYELAISQVGSVIVGWTDGLMQLKNGSKATLYVPSSLGYGKDGRAPKINPDAILVFNIEVMKVMDEEARMAEMEAEQKKQMDSLQKTTQPKQ